MEYVWRRPAKCNCKSELMWSHQIPEEKQSSQQSRKVRQHTAENANLKSNCPEGQQSPKDARVRLLSREGQIKTISKQGMGQMSGGMGTWRNNKGAEVEKTKLWKSANWWKYQVSFSFVVPGQKTIKCCKTTQGRWWQQQQEKTRN